uniref:G-protein coupled receptors family 2 profile 1 domain-containing protein n=1 Tax=Sander lucioperca TaxID=283035 RepID=A0A8C9XWQ1_SANLU
EDETIISLFLQMMCVCLFLSGRVSPTQLTCETLILLSTNLTGNFLSLFLNSSGVFCDLSVDGIGTCWPLSAAGQLISRPCPEQFNGIHYNTSSKDPSFLLLLTQTSIFLST